MDDTIYDTLVSATSWERRYRCICDISGFVNRVFCAAAGKGGFGALLRGQGGGHKTTNFDDCRDLNGRRLRHLKNEMKLAEWYAEQKALELEKKNKKRSYEVGFWIYNFGYTIRWIRIDGVC